MSPENFSAILGGLTDGAVGAILGFIGGFLLFKIAQKRKVIEFDVRSISLLRLNLKTDDILTVSVNKHALTGNMSDSGTVPLSSVYGFQINITNAGNEDIDKIEDIEITFDDSAKIVKCETEPISTAGYTITMERILSKPSTCRIILPYLNSNTGIIIRLITTENDNSNCDIVAHGVGIKTRRVKSENTDALTRLALMMSFLIIGTVFYAVGILRSFPYDLPKVSLDVTDISIGIAFAIIGLLLYIILFLSFLRKRRSRRISQNWDWKLPSTKNKQTFLQKLLN